MIHSLRGNVHLILSAQQWEDHTARLAEKCEGARGQDSPEHFPCLAVTEVFYLGSISIGPDDYEVRHTFLYEGDARTLLHMVDSTEPT